MYKVSHILIFIMYTPKARAQILAFFLKYEVHFGQNCFLPLSPSAGLFSPSSET